jgi:hypothetical protein
MNTQKYNGWTNYETWLCNLWFDNFDFEEVMDIFDDCQDRDDMLLRIEDYIKDYVEEIVEVSLEQPIKFGFISDMLNSSMQEIDYRDIAEHYIDDVFETYHKSNDENDDMYGEVA